MSMTVVTPDSSNSARPSSAPSRQVAGSRMARSALPHRLKPGLQRQVLDEASKQAVAGVAMHVDQPRHQDASLGIQHIGAFQRNRRRRLDGDDATIADGNRAILDSGHGIVACDDMVGANDEIGTGHVLFLSGMRPFIADGPCLVKRLLPAHVPCPKLAVLQSARPS